MDDEFLYAAVAIQYSIHSQSYTCDGFAICLQCAISVRFCFVFCQFYIYCCCLWQSAASMHFGFQHFFFFVCFVLCSMLSQHNIRIRKQSTHSCIEWCIGIWYMHWKKEKKKRYTRESAMSFVFDVLCISISIKYIHHQQTCDRTREIIRRNTLLYNKMDYIELSVMWLWQRAKYRHRRQQICETSARQRYTNAR